MRGKVHTPAHRPWRAAGLLAAAASLALLRPPAPHALALTLPPALPGAWPDEPPGFTAIGEQPFDTFTGSNWDMVYNDSGWTTLTTDSTAPLSPPGVAQFTYPPGFPGGIAPGTEYFRLPRRRAVFVGIWLLVSRPWQGHASNVNKIQFLFFQGGGDLPLVFYGPPGGPYELRAIPQFPGLPSNWLVPNVTHVGFTPGDWHRVEWLVVPGEDGASNGIVRWWLDGALIGDYADVVFPRSPISEYKLSPTWGGAGDVKRERDFYRVDQVHLSVR